MRLIKRGVSSEEIKPQKYLIISVFVILFHQFSETWIYDLITANNGHIKILPFFTLVRVWNRGMSFGMFNDIVNGPWLLSLLAVIITIPLLRWQLHATDKVTATALALVIGGAIGNTIDRLRYSAVADYLDFHFLGYHWPAFNFTDTAICIGISLLFLPTLHTRNIELNGS